MFSNIKQKVGLKLAQGKFMIATAKAAIDSGLVEAKVRDKLTDKSIDVKYRLAAAKIMYPLFDEYRLGRKTSGLYATKAELFKYLSNNKDKAEQYLNAPFKIKEL